MCNFKSFLKHMPVKFKKHNKTYKTQMYIHAYIKHLFYKVAHT